MGKYIGFLGFLFAAVFIHPLAAQQEGTVKGMLTDENNDPVIGANVLDLTNRKGAISDDAGRFDLRVPAGKEITLEISFMGYKKLTETVMLVPGQVLEMN